MNSALIEIAKSASTRWKNDDTLKEASELIKMLVSELEEAKQKTDVDTLIIFAQPTGDASVPYWETYVVVNGYVSFDVIKMKFDECSKLAGCEDEDYDDLVERVMEKTSLNYTFNPPTLNNIGPVHHIYGTHQ